MKSMNLSTCAMKQHKDFLRLIHSTPGAGDHLYLGESLAPAIERYVGEWLPLVAEQYEKTDCINGLIPPIDIAWIWHLHRLAPQRYAKYCLAQFGRILDPGNGAFVAQLEGQDLHSAKLESMALQTRQLWSLRYTKPFFAQTQAAGKRAPKGETDPQSNQTTLHPEVKAACDKICTEMGFDYDVGTCSSRQRTFLWQISQPSFEGVKNEHGGPGDAFLFDAIDRYHKFLCLMKVHGYNNHFFVPSYDIDFAWHTHMLANTSTYIEETAELAGAYPLGVDHDDSVNQRTEDSKLHRAWGGTKHLWQITFGETDPRSGGAPAEPIDKPGACYRGEPPAWWFEPAESIFRVQDHFLSAAEAAAALEQVARPENVTALSRSGFDMSVPVAGDIERRLRAAIGAGDASDEGAAGAAAAVGDGGVGAEDGGDEERAASTTRVPARVCPARKSVPLHKDKHYGFGPAVDSWVGLVYLTDNAGSSLVLVDDVDGREHKVEVAAGRMVCWPNARFAHRVDAGTTEGGGEEAGEVEVEVELGDGGALLGLARAMLGPMVLRGGAEGERLTYAEGGCGGCGGGCGGGGCGAGGCGGGGCAGGGGDAPINDTDVIRVLGVSGMLGVMLLPAGSASSGPTFTASPYNTHFKTKKTLGTTKEGEVEYMTEGRLSQALWGLLQGKVSEIEEELMPIAVASEPSSGCDSCCNPARLQQRQADAKRLFDLRELRMKEVSDALLAPLGLQLKYGGSNSVYYVEPCATPTAVPATTSTMK